MRPDVVQIGVTLDGFVHATSPFRAVEAPLRLDLIEAPTRPSGTAIHTYPPL